MQTLARNRRLSQTFVRKPAADTHHADIPFEAASYVNYNVSNRIHLLLVYKGSLTTETI